MKKKQAGKRGGKEIEKLCENLLLSAKEKRRNAKEEKGLFCC